MDSKTAGRCRRTARAVTEFLTACASPNGNHGSHNYPGSVKHGAAEAAHVWAAGA
jgi:hypothetical protein